MPSAIYHPTKRTQPGTSPLARFTSDIIDQMMPRARHLVVEAWTDSGCSGAGQRAQSLVAQAIGRAPAQTSDIEALVMKSAKNRLATHGLAMTYRARLAPRSHGARRFLRLLELVTEKLQATTKALRADERAVIVDGGALHNDLYPRWPLGALSYAEPLQRDLDGGVSRSI